MSIIGADDRWWEMALCAQVDPELWYPEKGGSVRDAKRLCRSCPVTAPCLVETVRVEAQEVGQPVGVRGGLTARERQPLVRKLRAEIGRESPRVVRIRRMAATGMDYAEMGRMEGIKPNSVGAICRQHGIEVSVKRPGIPRKRRKPEPVGGGSR